MRLIFSAYLKWKVFLKGRFLVLFYLENQNMKFGFVKEDVLIIFNPTYINWRWLSMIFRMNMIPREITMYRFKSIDSLICINHLDNQSNYHMNDVLNKYWTLLVLWNRLRTSVLHSERVRLFQSQLILHVLCMRLNTESSRLAN